MKELDQVLRNFVQSRSSSPCAWVADSYNSPVITQKKQKSALSPVARASRENCGALLSARRSGQRGETNDYSEILMTTFITVSRLVIDVRIDRIDLANIKVVADQRRRVDRLGRHQLDRAVEILANVHHDSEQIDFAPLKERQFDLRPAPCSWRQ